MRTLSILLLAISSLATAADQNSIPAPQHVLGVYANRTNSCFQSSSGEWNDCQGPVLDYAMIIPTADRQARVLVNLNFSNGHKCNFEGSAKWQGKVLQSYGDSGCELHFRFGNWGLKIEDAAGLCQKIACGARGSFDGAFLKKRGGF